MDIQNSDHKAVARALLKRVQRLRQVKGAEREQPGAATPIEQEPLLWPDRPFVSALEGACGPITVNGVRQSWEDGLERVLQNLPCCSMSHTIPTDCDAVEEDSTKARQETCSCCDCSFEDEAVSATEHCQEERCLLDQVAEEQSTCDIGGERVLVQDPYAVKEAGDPVQHSCQNLASISVDTDSDCDGGSTEGVYADMQDEDDGYAELYLQQLDSLNERMDRLEQLLESCEGHLCDNSDIGASVHRLEDRLGQQLEQIEAAILERLDAAECQLASLSRPVSQPPDTDNITMDILEVLWSQFSAAQSMVNEVEKRIQALSGGGSVIELLRNGLKQQQCLKEITAILQGFSEGLMLQEQKCRKTVESLGINVVAPMLGSKFDPKHARALQIDQELIVEKQIDKLIKPGFEKDGKLIRYADVSVRTVIKPR